MLIGVILLVAELNQSREMMRAQIRHDLAMGIVELLSNAANNNQFARMAIRASEDIEELSPDERVPQGDLTKSFDFLWK